LGRYAWARYYKLGGRLNAAVVINHCQERLEYPVAEIEGRLRAGELRIRGDLYVVDSQGRGYADLGGITFEPDSITLVRDEQKNAERSSYEVYEAPPQRCQGDEDEDEDDDEDEVLEIESEEDLRPNDDDEPIYLRLRTGGPVMLMVGRHNDQVSCSWRDEWNVEHREDFLVTDLVLAVGEGSA
jgi:hypothetical protein